MKERRKKRSHEEVQAAREAYLKAREEKKKLREQKLLERQKFQEERKQEKEKRAEERIQYRLELNKSREKKKEQRKRRRMSKKDLEGDGVFYPPYEGSIKVGDRVVARFAGSSIEGPIIYTVSPKDIFLEEEQEGSILYTILEGTTKYPVYRKDIYKKYE